jgi:predicted DsbA family dithiol-disulfide isomerase
MSDIIETTVCGIDGCGPAPQASAAPHEAADARRAVQVEIVSDAICPWCYVAKRQFERAVARLPDDVTVSVQWKPFELNPDMPPEGMGRVAYRSRKFGSWTYSQRLDAHVTAAAAQVGLTMRHDLMKRTPNTFDAHRLIWFAGREGVQDAAVEGLFSAYFVEGRDVGDRAVLADIAAGAGIDRDRATAFLAGTEGADAVSNEETAAQRSGVNGVPTFVINGQPVFSGAQRAELMLAHLQKAAGLS